MSSTEAALRIEDLCKSFGALTAVDGLSLEVRPGEMVGFLGPNGAGKSTTLYMIAGLVRPSAGAIRVFGCDLRKRFTQAMRHVGALVETPSFYEHLSARKNLELLARLRPGSGGEEISEILMQIGLSDRAGDKVGAYSQGMKQRLGLGATLLGGPRLLLLDEPTNGMDPEAMAEILTFIRRKVVEDGLAVFISSHLLAEVEEYCDRVAMMDKGRLIASGSVADILKPRDSVVRVVFADAAPAPDELASEEGVARVEATAGGALEITLSGRDPAWLNHFLVSRGCSISALAPKKRTLKQFFLSMTGDKSK